MTPLYEGKSKRLRVTENPDTLRMEFKNHSTAFSGEKKVSFDNKGRIASDPSIIVLADDISPDGCRLWDLKTGGKMDKDRFRRDIGNVMEACEEVLGRVKENLG